MELKIKRLHPDARMPTYGSDGAACFDLYACAPGKVALVMGREAQAATFDTGLAFEIPPGWVMKIYSRSGHGFKNDVRLANCVGVIDSDYRGQVAVRLTADHGINPLPVKDGDRIAQAMLVPVPRVTFCEVDELSETVRGAGGFGSTGN
jgi:dUTP pyrophosphatase